MWLEMIVGQMTVGTSCMLAKHKSHPSLITSSRVEATITNAKAKFKFPNKEEKRKTGN